MQGSLQVVLESEDGEVRKRTMACFKLFLHIGKIMDTFIIFNLSEILWLISEALANALAIKLIYSSKCIKHHAIKF